MKGVKLVELSEFKVKNYLGSNQIAQFKNFDFCKFSHVYPFQTKIGHILVLSKPMKNKLVVQIVMYSQSRAQELSNDA